MQQRIFKSLKAMIRGSHNLAAYAGNKSVSTVSKKTKIMNKSCTIITTLIQFAEKFSQLSVKLVKCLYYDDWAIFFISSSSTSRN